MSYFRPTLVFIGASLMLACSSPQPAEDGSAGTAAGPAKSQPAEASSAPADAPEAAAHVAPSQGSEKTGVAAKSDTGLKVFVSNYKDDTISVLEGDPLRETKVFASGGSPHGMAVRPTEPRLLAVANSTGFGVSFYDVDTYEEKAKLDDIVRGPQDVEFSPDGKWLYVAGPLSLDLHFIDVDAMKEVGDPVKFEGAKPSRILVSDDGKLVFALLTTPDSGEGANVAVIDVASRKILKHIPVGRFPSAMAIGNNGRTLVSSSFDDSTLTIIDVASLEVTKTMDSETGFGLAIHPTKPIAYTMASFDDEFHVMDLESGKTIKTVTGGQWPTFCAFGPDGRHLYIPHEESDSLVVFDTETNSVVLKIAVGKDPMEVAFYQQ